jgi:Family of unknown function (DUF6152)
MLDLSHERLGSLRPTLKVLALLGGLCHPLLATAHHSAAQYDPERIIETSGTLSEVVWQNPHVLLKVMSVEAGTTTTWEIECNPINTLERAGVDRRSLRVGDKIKVAGFASRLSPTHLFGTNLLTPGGAELLLTLPGKPQWQRGATSNLAASSAGGAPATPPTPGIFKVWSTVMSDPDANPYALYSAKVSLTPAARAAHAAWDSLRDTIAAGCTPQGMPTIMALTLPMQFEDHGATIALRIEDYDTVRIIHMTDDGAAPPGKSLLGYSVGKWVGDVLVVDTTGISWPYISPDGLRLGRSARLQERFSTSANGTRLRYTLTIDDPDTFTVPAILSRSWVWQPNERVRDYACGKTQDPRS